MVHIVLEKGIGAVFRQQAHYVGLLETCGQPEGRRSHKRGIKEEVVRRPADGCGSAKWGIRICAVGEEGAHRSFAPA